MAFCIVPFFFSIQNYKSFILFPWLVAAFINLTLELHFKSALDLWRIFTVHLPPCFGLRSLSALGWHPSSWQFCQHFQVLPWGKILWRVSPFLLKESDYSLFLPYWFIKLLKWFYSRLCNISLSLKWSHCIIINTNTQEACHLNFPSWTWIQHWNRLTYWGKFYEVDGCNQRFSY